VYSGDSFLLMEDLDCLKPTLFVSVPRIFMKIYDKIQTKLNQKNKFVKTIVEKALTSKIENLN